MSKLEIEFENELRENMLVAKKECGYNPTYFNRMIAEIGGVATAKKLIEKALATGKPSEGLATLFINKRKELSMEATVCKDKYQELFEKYEIEYCKNVLK